jgi:hypothetical protein
MTDEKKTTVIRIAGIDVPVHQAWNKIEALNTSADILEKLNNKYPNLATDFTHEIVPLTRERMKASTGNLKPPTQVEDKEDFAAFLKEKIQHVDPVELVDIAKNEKGVEISLEDLLYFIGEDEYMNSMERQAKEFIVNKISYKQMCEIWNEMHLPAPGKAHWTVSDLIDMLGEEDEAFGND